MSPATSTRPTTAPFAAPLQVGVETYAYVCDIDRAGVAIAREIPVITPRG